MAIIDFKATKCNHCYKCVRNCEVKAIMVKDGRAEIMPDNCILCGQCLQICPQSAKTLVSDLNLVKGMLLRGERVVVSIAPSYMGLLKYRTIGQVRAALMELGFADVRETSEGAALVTAEYARLLEEGKMENIITTCCPSVNDLIEIYYPQLDAVHGAGGVPDDRPRHADQAADGPGREGGLFRAVHRQEEGGPGRRATKATSTRC